MEFTYSYQDQSMGSPLILDMGPWAAAVALDSKSKQRMAEAQRLTYKMVLLDATKIDKKTKKKKKTFQLKFISMISISQSRHF